MLAAASVRSLMEIVRSETWERSGPLTQAVDPSVAAVPKTILHLEFERLLMGWFSRSLEFLGPWNRSLVVSQKDMSQRNMFRRRRQ